MNSLKPVRIPKFRPHKAKVEFSLPGMKNQSGQVLLFTLLALAVVTTIGLAIIGRTSTDVSISNRIEESARAFSAAEAGIERALLEGEDITTTVLTPGVNYTVNVTTQGGIGLFQFPNKSSLGAVETLWLTDHDSTTGQLDLNPDNDFQGASLDICWTNETTVPALSASVYYLTAGEYRTYRSVWDPSGRIQNATGSTTTPGAGCNVSGATNLYAATLSLAGFPGSDTLLALRLQPLFSETQVYINPSDVLPLQGKKVESIGETATGVTRKIVAFAEYRTPPVIFDSVIYTSGSLVK